MLNGISLLGVAVIVASSIGGGTGWGDLLALGMTASFALVIIIPRISPDVPSLPPTVVSAFLTLALFAPFGSVGSLDLHNWIVLAAFGATNFSLALVLFLAGAKRMPLSGSGADRHDGNRAHALLGLAAVFRRAARRHLFRRRDHPRRRILAHGNRRQPQ